MNTHHPDPAAPTKEDRSFEGFPIERFACPNSVYPPCRQLPPIQEGPDPSV